MLIELADSLVLVTSDCLLYVIADKENSTSSYLLESYLEDLNTVGELGQILLVNGICFESGHVNEKTQDLISYKFIW